MIQFLIALLLLSTPIAVAFYFFSGFASGFHLWAKVPEKVKRILRKIYPIPTFAVGGGAALAIALGTAHGCSYGVHETPVALRELPATVYLKPDHGRDEKAAKLIAPKLPKEKKKKKQEDENPAAAWLNQNQFVTFPAGATTFTCDQSAGICTSGNIATTGTATTFTMTGVMSVTGQQFTDKQQMEYEAHMTARFPPSEPPSKCVATCVNCHSGHIKRTWVTLVEERYCDGDHSDDDSMTLGWLKVGDVLEPNAWPAVNDTDHYSFDRNKHQLTERQ